MAAAVNNLATHILSRHATISRHRRQQLALTTWRQQQSNIAYRSVTRGSTEASCISCARSTEMFSSMTCANARWRGKHVKLLAHAAQMTLLRPRAHAAPLHHASAAPLRTRAGASSGRRYQRPSSARHHKRAGGGAASRYDGSRRIPLTAAFDLRLEGTKTKHIAATTERVIAALSTRAQTTGSMRCLYVAYHHQRISNRSLYGNGVVTAYGGRLLWQQSIAA